MARIDLTGQRFGTWTVASYYDFAANGYSRWNMVCDCGEQCVVYGSTLLAGKVRICRACKPERVKKPRKRICTMPAAKRLYIDLREQYPHEWSSWYSTHDRCFSPNSTSWDDYGGRGITIWPEWRRENNGFPAFLAYMLHHFGPRHEGFSIDRIDVNGNYEPGNVRWASAETQVHNRRPHVSSTRWLEFQGQRYSTSGFARLIGRGLSTVQRHINQGRAPEWIAAHFGYNVVAFPTRGEDRITTSKAA